MASTPCVIITAPPTNVRRKASLSWRMRSVLDSVVLVMAKFPEVERMDGGRPVAGSARNEKGRPESRPDALLRIESRRRVTCLRLGNGVRNGDIIFVASFDNPPSLEDIGILGTTAESPRRIFVVINKKDIVDDIQGKEAFDFVRGQLGQLFPQSTPKIFAISALRALEAKQSKNQVIAHALVGRIKRIEGEVGLAG